MYKVTLSMPVYNVERYVERALLSALNQTFDSIEYIIVDDKGTDESMEIIQRIISAHPRRKDIRIIDHGVNRGTGATKNSAIKEAQGEYLYFMDSDDEITPDCIQVLYDKMKETPVDIVVGSFCFYDENGNSLKRYINNNQCMQGEYCLAKYHFGGNPYKVETWNKLYNILFLRTNRILCIPHNLCEDNWFSFQVSVFAASLRLIDTVTYKYYQRKGSTVSAFGNLSSRLANEYSEITDYKINFLLSDAKAYKCPYILDAVILFIYGGSVAIANSKQLSSVEKKTYLKRMLDVNRLNALFEKYQFERKKSRYIFQTIMYFPNYKYKVFFLRLIRFSEKTYGKVRCFFKT